MVHEPSEPPEPPPAPVPLPPEPPVDPPAAPVDPPVAPVDAPDALVAPPLPPPLVSSPPHAVAALTANTQNPLKTARFMLESSGDHTDTTLRDRVGTGAGPGGGQLGRVRGTTDPS